MSSNAALKIQTQDSGPTLRVVPKSAAGFRPAGFWARFVAMFVDGVIYGLAMTPVQLLVNFLVMGSIAVSPGANGQVDMNEKFLLATAINYALSFAGATLYFGYFYSKKGATPGKMLMGLRVVRTDNGANVGYARAFSREVIGKMLSMILVVGYILPIFRKDKRALHDLMTGTQVIQRVK